MRIAIDLLWVKPKKSGGIESYIRNLLDGFLEIKIDNKYILILAKDNEKTFSKYFIDERFEKIICNVNSENIDRRILFQNIKLNKILIKSNVDICFEPIYSKPILNNKNLKFITTIHDLQAIHYPKYFSKFKYYWMKFSWERSIKTSKKIIAISNFVKNDILSQYKINSNKVEVIYNPICIDKNFINKAELEKKFNVKQYEYYYTVAQLLPHKNLETLIKVIKKIKDMELDIPRKLLISGVNGKSSESLNNLINEYGLENEIFLTGYIDNEERNSLYMNCNAFLFSSIFEGFGMPPIEAMMLGSRVITTKCASLYEVTEGKAYYVNNPYEVDEWIKKIISIQNEERKEIKFKNYNKKNIAKNYLNVFKNAIHE